MHRINFETTLQEHEILFLWESYALSYEHGTWTICFNSANSTYYVQEIRQVENYNEFVELGRFDSAKRLFFRTADLDKSALIEWIEKGKAITVPKAKQIMGCDGATYGFKYRDEFPLSQLDWWEFGPPEWKPIIDWYHDFRTWLKSELDKAESSSNQKI